MGIWMVMNISDSQRYEVAREAIQDQKIASFWWALTEIR